MTDDKRKRKSRMIRIAPRLRRPPEERANRRSDDVSSYKPEAEAYRFTIEPDIDHALEILQVKINELNKALLPKRYVDLNVERLHDDFIRFRIQIMNISTTHHYDVGMVGAMRRWEGTRTRIDADIDAPSLVPPRIDPIKEQKLLEEHRRQDQPLINLTLSIFFVLVIVFMAGLMIDAANTVACGFFLLVLGFFVYPFFESLTMIRRKYPWERMFPVTFSIPKVRAEMIDQYKVLAKLLVDTYKTHDIQHVVTIPQEEDELNISLAGNAPLQDSTP